MASSQPPHGAICYTQLAAKSLTSPLTSRSCSVPLCGAAANSKFRDAARAAAAPSDCERPTAKPSLNLRGALSSLSLGLDAQLLRALFGHDGYDSLIAKALELKVAVQSDPR